ncbi:helix-turn-helix domain-containing protein [Psychrobacillus sp. NPDC096426]|uniref:helix-turn-helix domain-containing protein n=1 Tax=Psychrobacillus sp. NPDC096426 TaxID=3364491 RepID=UPI003820D6DA
MQNDVGSTLKNIRKSKKLTQQQLAEKTNLSRTYLSDVENNRYNPSITFIKSISEGLANGDENSAKEIYTTLMNALGYVEEQSPIEKATSEYISLTEFIGTIVNSYKSSQLQIKSQKEILEKTNINEDRKNEIANFIIFHETRLKDNDKILLEALHRKNELETLIEDEIRNRRKKINELLVSIDK